MSGTSVQFRRPEQVIEAFRLAEIVHWSIWHRSQMLHLKYCGTDIAESEEQLTRALQTLTESAATYTIKFYEDLPVGKAGRAVINGKTPDSGALNFRFLEETWGNPSTMVNRETEKQIAGLRLELEQLKAERDEDDDDDEQDDLMGAINGMIKEYGPVVIPQLIGRFINVPAPAAINGIPNVISNLDEALAVLKQSDPLFEKHLIRLAEIARDKPGKFKGLISMMSLL